jgi:hypothetical protein
MFTFANSKKFLISSSVAVSFILIVLDRIGTVDLCTLNGEFNRSCLHFLFNLIVSLALPIFSFTFFAIVTGFMREAIFRAWFKFARWWIPLSVFLALITPDGGGGGFGPGIGVGKGDVALLMSVIFIITSLVIIVRAYRSNNAKQK